MKLFLLVLSTLLLTGTACLTPNPFALNPDRQTERIAMELGPCFGRCPVYTLTVYQNGLVTYDGERFTTRQGLWGKMLPRDEIVRLVDAFERAPFESYQNMYKSQIPDLAAVTIRYTDAEGKTKSVIGKDGRPDDLIELESRLRRIAESEQGWTSLGGDTGRRGDNIPRIVPGELIVELRPDVDPNAWIVRYGRQKVRIKEQIAPNQPYYLVIHETDLMPTEELLGWLRQDPDVVSAQTNARPVEYRDR
jgi:hypothetical protein